MRCWNSIVKICSLRSKDVCFNDCSAHHQLAAPMSLSDFLTSVRTSTSSKGLYLWAVLLQSEKGTISKGALAQRRDEIYIHMVNVFVLDFQYVLTEK